MTFGCPPSKLALAAARFAWAELKAGTFGLAQDAYGLWESVDNYGDSPNKWQRILTLVQIRKGMSPGGRGAYVSDRTIENASRV